MAEKEATIAGAVTPRKAAVLRVLGNPSFRSLWIGQLCGNLAVTTTMFVLALRIYQITGSSTAVSALYLTFGVPAFLFAMAAGAIVDHFDKRTILLLAHTSRAALAALFLFAFQSVPLVYALAFLYAFITQFSTPSEAPTIPRLVGKSDLVTANSIFSLTFYSALAIGSILAGPTLRFFGPSGVFVFLCSIFLLAAVAVWQIPKEVGKKTVVSILATTSFFYLLARVFRSIEEGLDYIKTRNKLLDALVLLMGTQVTLAILATLGPAFAVRLLEVDVHDASLFLVGPTVLGILVGALWVGNKGYKLGTKKLIQRGVIGAGVLLIIIATTARFNHVPFFFIIVIGLFFALGFANSLLDVPANTTLQHESEGDMRGRVYGILTAVVGGIGMLPVLVGGVLADVVGVGKVIFLLGLFIAGYGFWRVRYNTN
ncbi:MFS transporter [Candidatus Gottesmanbacteria bacterium]|nr:MFS transporter [Candidatus Gottesmanbacteria bacterium]